MRPLPDLRSGAAHKLVIIPCALNKLGGNPYGITRAVSYAVSGRYYVGGFVGATKENVALHITNDQVPADTVGGTVTEANANNNTWSYNGDIDSASGQITGLGYVGGLFGELGAAGHQIQGVFSTAVVGTTASSTSSDGTHIGGLIGIMNGGTLTQCFVTTPKDTAVNIESNLGKIN